MTSREIDSDAEDVLDGEIGQWKNKKSKNRFENSRDFQPEEEEEEEPCLESIKKGLHLTEGNEKSASNNSIGKNSTSLMECDNEEKAYFAERNDFSPVSNSKKSRHKFKLAAILNGNERNENRKRFDCGCESEKIRKKFGLTRCGFSIGLLLLCAVIIFLLVIIVLGVTWPRIPHGQQFPICIKSPCLRSSALVLSKLDRTKSPCEDFYNFTCGSWTKKHSKPPPARSKWGTEQEMDLKMSEFMRDVISVLPHQTRTNSLTWKIKNFYDSCMSLDNIETDNERPLRKIITELGGWNVLRNFQVLSWEFSKTLVKLHVEYGVTPFFSVTTVSDPRNATKSILKLSPSGLGLPDITYYYREKEDRISSSYCRYMKDVSRQLGATSIDANSFSEDMFYFERRIAEATPSPSELEDVRKHQIQTISALKMSAPSVPLHEILDAMFNKADVNENTEVLVTSNVYLTKISNIIATTDRSALNNYVIWNLVKEYLPYLSQNFQDIYSVYNREMTGAGTFDVVTEPKIKIKNKEQVHQANGSRSSTGPGPHFGPFVTTWKNPASGKVDQMPGATNLIDRWEFCIKTLQRFMDVGLGVQIEKSVFSTNAKANIRVVGKIFETVRQIVKESITKAKWIELELYKHFVSKVNNMSVQIGFPETYLDSSYLEDHYSKLYVQKNNFFQNILYGVSFLQEDKRRKYISPKEDYKWLSSIASESKIVFVPSANKIIIPQRLLHEPYYEPEYPLPVLYATLGVQISREMISSLVKYSGLYSSNGSLVADGSLVANLTLTSFDHQLNCLADSSVKNEIVEDRERANKTSLNTFAIVSAIKQALKALKKASADVEHVHQAGLEDFDDESFFYIAYGQSLSESKTSQERDKEKTAGTSLNGSELLKVVRLQLKSFAEAFDCSLPGEYCKHIL